MANSPSKAILSSFTGVAVFSLEGYLCLAVSIFHKAVLCKEKKVPNVNLFVFIFYK